MYTQKKREKIKTETAYHSGVNKQNHARWNGHSQFGVTAYQHESFGRFVPRHALSPQQYYCERWPFTSKYYNKNDTQQTLPAYAHLYTLAEQQQQVAASPRTAIPLECNAGECI